MSRLTSPHITKAPDFCGRRACIVGHRLRVLDIVVGHERRYGLGVLVSYLCIFHVG